MISTKGLAAYSRPSSSGGVSVDIEGMFVDAITVLKASGHTKAMAQELFDQVWSNVKVEINTTNDKKDS